MVQPQAPRLGFLSAIRAGLRQLEESTGYVDAAPNGSAAASGYASPASTASRIVYYQAPPREVLEQMHGGSTPSATPSVAGGAAYAASQDGVGTTDVLRVLHRKPSNLQNGSVVEEDAPGGVQVVTVVQDGGGSSVRGSVSTPSTPTAIPAMHLGPAAPSLPPMYPSSVGSAASQAAASGKGGAGDWFTSLFRKATGTADAVEATEQLQQRGGRRQSAAGGVSDAYSERAMDMYLLPGGGGGSLSAAARGDGGLTQYGRCV